LRERKAHYLVGTPWAQLRQFEAALLDKNHWHQVREDVEVKLLDHPDGAGQEQFVLCRSQARQEKEKAMLARQQRRTDSDPREQFSPCNLGVSAPLLQFSCGRL
jgi:hypothetical protein